MENTTKASVAEPSRLQPKLQSANVGDLFREYGTFVWRTLRRLGVRDADVDDACQEVFMVVHRKLAEFEGRSSIRTWIYGIAVRVAAAERRAAKSRPPPATASAPELIDARTPYEASVNAEALTQLDRALDSLDDDKRATFVLYEVEDLTMSEVAEALSCPLQTAYSRHAAARAEVERFFRQQGRISQGASA
ncbi:MAG: sigma-70 family RNA polymerase sigma factor [Polyangiaceae bacterium]